MAAGRAFASPNDHQRNIWQPAGQRTMFSAPVGGPRAARPRANASPRDASPRATRSPRGASTRGPSAAGRPAVAATGKFTVYLNKEPGATVYVAYLILD